MLIDVFQESWKELQNALKDKKHPFNSCTLATVGKNSTIRQRTIILRGITKNNSLLFYTDLRSTKIKHIQNNPKCNLLFYDPKLQFQVTMRGEILIHTNNDAWEKHIGKIEGKAVNNYNTLLAPGKAITNPLALDRIAKLHFALLEFVPASLEYLKLKQDSNHVRAKFQLQQGVWKKTFLVP